MHRAVLAHLPWLLSLLLAACSASGPDPSDGDAGPLAEGTCSTSADCPRGQCTLGQCIDGFCAYAAIACDGGIASDCTTTADCGLDACGRQKHCVAGYCGELQRECDAGTH